MPRLEGNTRARIAEAAYKTFYKEGFARARVDTIARAAGVTKKTFYYYFDSKDRILAVVLEWQSHLVLHQIAGWMDRVSGGPAEMIQSVFDELGAWAQKPEWRGSGFTRCAMELADLPGHPARVIARKHKGMIEAGLAMKLREHTVPNHEQIARQIMLLIEGCQSLILIHGDPEYAKAASEVAVALIKNAGSVEQPR